MTKPATGERMKRDLTRQQYLDLYYCMRLNRAVEDTMVKLFRQNKIVGGLYSSLGQEAISVGSAYALEKKDWLPRPSGSFPGACWEGPAWSRRATRSPSPTSAWARRACGRCCPCCRSLRSRL